MLTSAHYGLRSLNRSLGFSARVIITVGIGIGCCTIVFSAFNTLVLRILPYPHADRLVAISGTLTDLKIGGTRLSQADILDIRENTRTVASLGAYKEDSGVNLSNDSWFEHVSDVQVSADFFKTIGVRPLLGRPLEPRDSHVENSRVLVLSYSLWAERFAFSQDVPGRTVYVDGTPHTIVGVMPANFEFPSAGIQVWLPEVIPDSAFVERAARDTVVFGRLKDGIGLSAAQAEMEVLGTQAALKISASDQRITFSLARLDERMVGSVRRVLVYLLGVTGLVLLVGCANVANLILIRNVSRGREIAIKRALGAGPGRIFAELFSESTLLALAGGAFGLVASVVGLHIVRSEGALLFPRLGQIALDARVVAFTCFISILTAILCGVIPSIQAIENDVNTSLKNTVSRMSGRSSKWRRDIARNAFLIAQISLVVVLLVSAMWLLRGLLTLTSIKVGYDARNLYALQLSSRFGDKQSSLFFRHALEIVGALPNITSVALDSLSPLSGNSMNVILSAESVRSGWVSGLSAEFRVVSSSYFHTMGIPVLRGKSFEEVYSRGAVCEVIVNEAASAVFWPGEDSVGKRIDLNSSGSKTRYYCFVAGVVENSRDINLTTPPGPQIYFSDLQRPQPGYVLLVRSTDAQAFLAGTILHTLRTLDRNQQLIAAASVEDAAKASILGPHARTVLVGCFAAFGLSLAGIGIYGIASFAVSQRLHEIGIRICLGADTAEILILIFRGTLISIASGIGIGFVIAFILGRLLESVLFGVKPAYAASFITVAVIISTVASLAGYVPARRGTKIDPKILLRCE